MKNVNNSGTYAYDKKTGKVVKVSSSVPSLKKDKTPHTCCGDCCNCSHN